MILFLLSYLGGVLTILSPCILPVLPFVFARADQPFVKSGLPLLLGMALTFAVVATLAAIGGGWAVHANQYGRIAALVLLAFFGVTLLSRSLADRMTRPLVALGDRLSNNAGSGAGASFVLGIATGLLWAPCAGPILGLVLTGAAINGASASTNSRVSEFSTTSTPLPPVTFRNFAWKSRSREEAMCSESRPSSRSTFALAGLAVANTSTPRWRAIC